MTPINHKYQTHHLQAERFLATFDRVLLPAIKGAVLAFLLILTYGVAESRAAIEQTAYIKSLEGLLDKCLSPGDHPITIGDELWFCGAANSGIKAK